MADSVDQSALECCSGFRAVAVAPGYQQTLLVPDVAADGGECVAEGRAYLRVPGAGRGGLAFGRTEACRQQGDKGEQPKQAGRGAADGQIRPLAQGFDAEVSAGFLEGDLRRPALDEPADDPFGRAAWVSAQQGLGVEP